MANVIVYVQFPRKHITDDDQAYLDPANWANWTPLLTFPVDTVNALNFSLNPLKWVRYCTGVVVGARGDLYTDRDPHQHARVDYLKRLPTADTNFYYHVADNEKLLMFPIVPKPEDERSVTFSGLSARRDAFRVDVEQRDGSRCVVTGWNPEVCEAVHLLAHSKGDEYIESLTRNRIERRGDGEPITGIDDVRNGLFLGKGLHSILGHSVAILKTPNFAMESTDLVLIEDLLSVQQQIWVAHFFNTGSVGFVSGSRLRPPERPDLGNWPPAAVFDAVYAAAVMQSFGVKATEDDTIKIWGGVFYPGGGPMTSTQADAANRHGNQTEDATEREVQRRQREEQARKRANRGVDAPQDDGYRKPDVWDMLLLLPMIRIPPEELRASLAKAQEKKREELQKRNREKVTSWRTGVS